MIINNDVVRQIGTADEILNRPANVFVAQFFGDPPINLVERGGGGDHVDLGDLKIPISAPEALGLLTYTSRMRLFRRVMYRSRRAG